MYDNSKSFKMGCRTVFNRIRFSSVPKISPLQIVRVLKQQSTIQMWRRYASELKKQYWKENTFWTDGYFCSTIGEVSSKTLKHYIQNQG